MLLVFQELANENPYQYFREFKDICETIKYNQMTKESLKLWLFSFFLKEIDKACLLSLQPGTITTWVDLAEAFNRKSDDYFCTSNP